MKKTLVYIGFMLLVFSGCTTAKNCVDFIGFIRKNKQSKNKYINLTFNLWFSQDTVSLMIGDNSILDRDILNTKKEVLGGLPAQEYLIVIKQNKLVGMYDKSNYSKENLIKRKVYLENGSLHFKTNFNNIIQNHIIDIDSTKKIWISHSFSSDTLRLVCDKYILYYD